MKPSTPDYQRVAAVLVRIGLRVTSTPPAGTVPEHDDTTEPDGWIDGDSRTLPESTVLTIGATGEAGQPRH